MGISPFSRPIGRRGFLGAAALAAGATALGTSYTDDVKLDYLRILIDNGLPRTTAPKKIIVVGAGIAGLVAADLLRTAGHDVTILEANAMFGSQVYREFTGVGATQSWTRNRYSLGEAAIFTPGQPHEYHAATRTVEGRVHFAGEHTSLKPAWIEGSLESAVRTALEVHQNGA